VGRRIPEYNRHHILFPERIWKKILGENADFRSVFVVKMRTSQHERLHRKLDSELKDELTVFDFPKTSTLQQMILDYSLQKGRFQAMNIYQKIDWLLSELDPRDRRNKLLISLLKKQRSFLKFYKVL
jgi:hypothetical protein